MQIPTQPEWQAARLQLPTREYDYDLYGRSNLHFYRRPPTETVDLVEFERLATDRLRLLQAVESCRERFPKFSDDYLKAMDSALQRLNWRVPACSNSEGTANAVALVQRRRDYISHFVLRLAFCKSPDAQRWFITQELDLFKYRFSRNRGDVSKVLAEGGVHFEKVDEEQKKELELMLCAASRVRPALMGVTDFWLVPFVNALDLVKGRRVLLRRGVAFVPQNEMVVIVASKFRRHLAQTLATAARHFDLVLEDDRLRPVLQRLSNKSYVGKSYTDGDSGERIRPDMIDSLAQTSFPLCMRQLHSNLRRQHHLRHGGRMQYGLFLKGIGLSLDDAMRFWRAEFTQAMDVDKFEKQYAYNIRHNYGKEGKRVDYTPFACVKVITTNAPGALDCHGCPFKHSDAQVLRQKLESARVAAPIASKIVTLSGSGRFDLACSRFFEATHDLAENSIEQLIGHPNQYFEDSRKVLARQRGDVGSQTPTPTTSTASSQEPPAQPMEVA